MSPAGSGSRGGAEVVPIGTEHVVTGLLLVDRDRPVLNVDGGGTWRLELCSFAGQHFGDRVTIKGRRVGFDVLEVDWIRRSGTSHPTPLSWWRWALRGDRPRI
ncbi:DUF5818 domain-containing protein [Sphingomonas sp.]|uniref:DUF5818 domain-containing protein n=1 Tax=Sphingomonas sp. TaxID=28214 RepID=UPI002E378759|nr:DUF5818 domain-containing protein [Sphingomonas sp.]HEX4693582.1 DUF5818 domain-containing protein [Sphingomonas sp.]